MDFIDTIIAKLMIWSLRRSYGADCKTKDTEDFHDLKAAGLLHGRCPSCAAQDVVEYLEDHIHTINIFNPHTQQKGWEERFDAEFANAGGDYDGSVDPIKQFISSLLTEQKKRVVEMVEKMEIPPFPSEGEFGKTISWAAQTGYQDAKKDLLTKLHEI